MNTAIRATVRRALACVRCSGASDVLVGSALSIAALLVATLRRVDVPGRFEVREVIWPFAPLVASAGFGALCELTSRKLELFTVRGRWSVLVRVYGLAGLMAIVLIFLGGPDREVVLARNWMAFTGLALLSCRLFDGRAVWMLGLITSTSMWLLGSTTFQAQTWAILFRPPDDRRALAVSAGVFVVGLCWATRWFVRRRN